MILFTIFIINLILISICLFVHYEIFVQHSNMLARIKTRHRTNVFWAMIFVVFAHTVQVWIFAIAYYICSKYEELGILTGNLEHNFLDYVYYSFVIYTSLGLGDIVPRGPIRFTTGIESLIGLVMIAWSASYMYYQMQKYWRND